MTLVSNQPYGLRLANALTAVPPTRVSIGPPIMIIELGVLELLREASSETAPSAGTVGWHTDTT